MISIFVVGVLLAVAYPSFMDQLRKSRRADAVAALTAVQQAQERWRANNLSYANFNTAGNGNPPNGLQVASHSGSGYYTLTINGLSPTGYTVLATATEGRSQASDTACRQVGVRAAAGVLSYGSGEANINWAAANPDPGNCWAR